MLSIIIAVRRQLRMLTRTGLLNRNPALDGSIQAPVARSVDLGRVQVLEEWDVTPNVRCTYCWTLASKMAPS